MGGTLRDIVIASGGVAPYAAVRSWFDIRDAASIPDVHFGPRSRSSGSTSGPSAPRPNAENSTAGRYVLEDRFETEGGLWLAPTRALLWGCLNFEGRVSNHVDTSGQLNVLALLDVLGTGQLDIAASADSARVTPKQAACYAYVSVADYAWLAMREAARRFVTRVTFDRCAY